MVEMTKAGYDYVISNIGSVGVDMFKICWTRRLEPIDRLEDLQGDALLSSWWIFAQSERLGSAGTGGRSRRSSLFPITKSSPGWVERPGDANGSTRSI